MQDVEDATLGYLEKFPQCGCEPMALMVDFKVAKEIRRGRKPRHSPQHVAL